MERKYGFREQLQQVHTPGIGKASSEPRKGMCLIDEGWEVILSSEPSRLGRYVGHDLRDFFEVSLGMALKVRFTEDIPAEKRIYLTTDPSLASEKNQAFRITVTSDAITVVGKTERGMAQGAYLLEDHMNRHAGPYVPCMERLVEPMFSPRMTHSGFQLDTFPDEYLKAVAHAGMDAVIIYASDLYKMHNGFPNPDALWEGTCQGFCDFNDLIWRAEGYGIDVYVYSHYKCDVHPAEPGARDYYASTFGTLFKVCPKLKGIIFVGETFEFPSRDPHTIGKRCQLRTPEDEGFNVGWYPCCDYPELVAMVQDVIYEHNPEADIVFWSYNWGGRPADARLALIRSLPKGISLLVTFDMFERFRDAEENAEYGIDDYSISFEGPGAYFISEAEEAKRLGIRLYAMANTGGRTWDVGDVPYLPFPYQWAKRYEKLAESHDRYGLSGLMESHHYGWVPSFISELAKYAYQNHSEDLDAAIDAIALRDFGVHAAQATKAWRYFSDACRLVIASALDQCGPYRIGPSYPLVFDQDDVELPTVPYGSHSGNTITFPYYRDNAVLPITDAAAVFTLHRIEKALTLFEKGNACLRETLEGQTGSRLLYAQKHYALCKFIENTYRTTVHVKRWNILKTLLTSGDAHPLFRQEADTLTAERTASELVRAMNTVAEAEIANALDTIQYCETDSLLGYEPTMEYMCSRIHIEWKVTVVRESMQRLAQYASELS